MSLNIKNERTHALVRELATLRGVSQTEAVEEAVRARLAELNADQDRQARFERIMAIAQEMAPGLREAGVVSTDFLYDEYGLPK
jgi:antitoxin VapB